MSPFVIKLFLLPFSSHCSTQNIGFSDSGYVIKPPQASSAVHGAPPFTGYPICLSFAIQTTRNFSRAMAWMCGWSFPFLCGNLPHAWSKVLHLTNPF